MRVTIRDLKRMKSRGERVPMLTAYDYTSALLVEAAGVPLILVGDSLGQWVLGYGTTLPVTMDDMVHHVKAVVRGTETAHVVADMPFMSYQAEPAEAVRNAGRMLQEGGAQSVKLEGGVSLVETVGRLVTAGIPVMGHIGFTPQSYNQIGGYRVQGRFPKAAASLIDDAVALESAGCYAVVLEMVPAQLASLITERLSIPTIGIASGVHCDGQVQVFHDMFGLIEDFVPKHARRYADLGAIIKSAVSEYAADVRSASYPSDEESHQMKPEALEKLTADLAGL
jgi:3-methyl-2-oxobutanoate hydroxymethyltransferase